YGGVLLLVVHIRGEKKKAYYKILGPLDIRHELLEMGGRKYRSISLIPFPDDFDSQIRIAKLAHHKCQINKLRLTDDQFSLATGAQLLAADPIDLNKPGKFGIGSDIPSHIELT